MRQVLDYQVLWIIKQNLSKCKFLHTVFCYCSYTWDAQLIRGVFHLDISFSCWFRGIRVPFCVLWKALQFLPGKLKDQENVDQESSELKKLME